MYKDSQVIDTISFTEAGQFESVFSAFSLGHRPLRSRRQLPTQSSEQNHHDPNYISFKEYKRVHSCLTAHSLCRHRAHENTQVSVFTLRVTGCNDQRVHQCKCDVLHDSLQVHCTAEHREMIRALESGRVNLSLVTNDSNAEQSKHLGHSLASYNHLYEYVSAARTTSENG